MLTDAVLELEGEELACFGGKFAREFLEHIFTETADHSLDGVFALDATTFEVERLVLASCSVWALAFATVM